MKEIREILYDIKGYFIPGAILLTSLLLLVDLCGYTLEVPLLLSLPAGVKAAILVALSYSLGHVMHSIANCTIDKMKSSNYPPKFYFENCFSDKFSRVQIEALHTAVVKQFKLSCSPTYSGDNSHIKDSYWECFQFVINKGNAETENFLSLTGFYRGMTVTSICFSLIYFACAVLFMNITLCIIGVLGLAFGWLFFKRVSRFNKYLADTVYSNFIYLAKELP